MLSPQCPAPRFPGFDYNCCGKSGVLTKTVFELFKKKYIFAHRHLADDIFAKVFSPAAENLDNFRPRPDRKHSALRLICSQDTFCVCVLHIGKCGVRFQCLGASVQNVRQVENAFRTFLWMYN